MKKGLKLAEGFLATQLNYMSALMVIFTVYAAVLKTGPNGMKYVLLGIVPFCFYLVRKYVYNIVLYFILHLVIGAFPYLLASDIAEKVFFILISVTFCGISIYFKVAKKIAEDSVLFPAMTFVLVIVCYFSVLSRDGEIAAGRIALIAVVYVILYMIYEYLRGYTDYIQNNEVSNQNIPKGRIFKTSFGTLVGFLILFAGFAQFFIKGNFLGNLVYKIGDLLKRFIIWLLSMAPDAMEGTASGEDVTGNIHEVTGDGAAMKSLYEISPEAAKVIENIVTIGAYMIAVVAVLLIAYGIFRAIFAAFKVKRTADEEETVLVREKVSRIKRSKKGKRIYEKLSGRDGKVRKMYEETIAKNAIEGISGKQEQNNRLKGLTLKTPTEQCRDFQNRDNIKMLYEKARYSNKEITKDDVKRMKEACKNV